MKHNPTIRDIDIAWERINALGGTPRCAHDHVYCLAINDALKVIESLGGSDPAARRYARKAIPFPGLKLGTPPRLCAEDTVMPLVRLDALNGDDGGGLK